MCCSSGSNATRPRPLVVRVIGTSNSGKTTLIEQLVPRLRARGLRVGTVKHAPHGFELDRPGKDSWRHAQAGAEAVAVISPERAAWIMHRSFPPSVVEAIWPMADRVDLALVEGFKQDDTYPAICLEPCPNRRLKIGAERCWVGVHPCRLSPKELERLASFCIALFTRRERCRRSPAGP